MHVLLTGATGSVGRFVAEALAGGGARVTTLGRTGDIGWRLGETPRLPAADALVHAAFHHVPGRFRGGEGDDPAGFRRANVEGSRRLLDAAAAAGVPRLVAMSSRAVYGDGRADWLRETDRPVPDTLYGRVKLALEAMLPGYPGVAVAVRATGVYGLAAGSDEHKWRGLFAGWLRGATIAPRVATEVHGADLAAAILLLLSAPPEAVRARAFNVSDLLLDRHDLIAAIADAANATGALPPRAAADRVGRMATDRLEALGWRPGGRARLLADLPRMAAIARSDAAAASP